MSDGEKVKLHSQILLAITLITAFLCLLIVFELLWARGLEREFQVIKHLCTTLFVYLTVLIAMLLTRPKKNLLEIDDPEDADDMYRLAHDYARGRNGKRVNESLGGHWLTKAAENGLPHAMEELGENYLGDEGRPIWGLPVDPKRAIYWLTRAIQEDDEDVKISAMVKLASCYYDGIGVSVNRHKARVLYQNAASLGDSGAQEMLDTMF